MQSNGDCADLPPFAADAWETTFFHVKKSEARRGCAGSLELVVPLITRQGSTGMADEDDELQALYGAATVPDSQTPSGGHPSSCRTDLAWDTCTVTP